MRTYRNGEWIETPAYKQMSDEQLAMYLGWLDAINAEEKEYSLEGLKAQRGRVEAALQSRGLFDDTGSLSLEYSDPYVVGYGTLLNDINNYIKHTSYEPTDTGWETLNSKYPRRKQYAGADGAKLLEYRSWQAARRDVLESNLSPARKLAILEMIDVHYSERLSDLDAIPF